MGYDAQDQRDYQWVGHFSYFNQCYDNYFVVRLPRLQRGKYTLRLLSNGPTDVALTLGVYSEGVFAFKALNGVDDD